MSRPFGAQPGTNQLQQMPIGVGTGKNGSLAALSQSTKLTTAFRRLAEVIKGHVLDALTTASGQEQSW